jgi:hypothetical protein
VALTGSQLNGGFLSTPYPGLDGRRLDGQVSARESDYLKDTLA